MLQLKNGWTFEASESGLRLTKANTGIDVTFTAEDARRLGDLIQMAYGAMAEISLTKPVIGTTLPHGWSSKEDDGFQDELVPA